MRCKVDPGRRRCGRIGSNEQAASRSDGAHRPRIALIAAITLAELAAGPHATEDKDERARRQDRLQWATSTWDPLPFDEGAARMYDRMFSAARAAGQTSRSRLVDILIASTAAANGLPVYIRNPSDFEALKAIIKVVPV